ncbi:MAG: endolytic transglycosylase MltG [Anaerolineales bacterium]
MMRRFVVLMAVLAILVLIAFLMVPALAVHTYGPPTPGLSLMQDFQYSATLLWDDGLLTRPLDPGGAEQAFTVDEGESIESVAGRLELAGIIRNAGALRDYLTYTGLDKSLQAGDYKVSPGMSVVDIASLMQDATPSDITFVVWPGWRMEEVAAALPTSGMSITPEEFLAAATEAPARYDFLAGKASSEGFLYPDSYLLSRTTTVDQLVETLLRNFSLHLTVELSDAFQRQGLSLYDAVSVASIVQRESVKASEAPMIASVYLNRLRKGMKLDADPTVQYALGYDPIQRTWWTNPLSLVDLQVVSPYNTYINDGLPPTPIDNPGDISLQAVAKPADTPYYYFSARCDGSGYHQFAETFQEHLTHLCP